MQLYSPLSHVIACKNYDLFSLDMRRNFENDNFFGYWLPFVRGDGLLLALGECDVDQLGSKSILCAIFLVPDPTWTTTRTRTPKFFITRANCPDGSQRIDHDSGFRCTNCSVGSYSFDGSSCLKCPKEVTTKKTGSTSIKDCNICSDIGKRNCRNGYCNVTANSTWICQCNRGYNRDKNGYCTVRSTILIATLSSSGAILLLVVTGISIILY